MTSKNTVSDIILNDKNSIPQLGYGVWQIDDKEADKAVYEAIEVGYRHIDTAKIYGNEVGVGKGIANSGLNRADIFLTTKLWNSDQGYQSSIESLHQSLERLKLDYVDLYLIHWPCPKQNKYLESWEALIELKNQGLAKSIGVSNFNPEQITEIVEKTSVVPVINQIELHPYYNQSILRDFNSKHNIITEAYSPLGRTKEFSDSLLNQLSQKYNKSVPQIILRWHIQIGNVVIPKTSNVKRMQENYDVFDFELSVEDINAINNLNDLENGSISETID